MAGRGEHGRAHAAPHFYLVACHVTTSEHVSHARHQFLGMGWIQKLYGDDCLFPVDDQGLQCLAAGGSPTGWPVSQVLLVGVARLVYLSGRVNTGRHRRL